MYLIVENVIFLTLILVSFVAFLRLRNGKEEDGSSAELKHYMRIIPIPSGRRGGPQRRVPL